jgi:O-antigen/teichoic acid export membrane protein
MRELLSGTIAAAAFVAALYFLKFWRRSADRLFALFAAAFGLLAVNAVALGLPHPVGEFEVAAYLVRLAAFILILIAIFDKNRGP